MTIPEFLLHSYFLVPLALLLLGFCFYYFFRHARLSTLKRSLDFQLFEISLPRPGKEEGKSFKDTIAKVEQFYYGMLEVKPYFVLEIVSPSTENETNFYAAVPRQYASFLEKQVYSIFPEAELRHESADYNIFKYGAPNAGALVTLKQNNVLPIKTYENLAADPTEIIANTFSSLEREKDGAAVQIVVDTTGNDLKQNIERSIKLLEAGTPLKTALKGGESLAGSFLKVLSGGRIHEDSDAQTMSQDVVVREARGEIIKLLNEKISRPVLRANIRLVVSSSEPERAGRILNEIKSFFSQFTNPVGNSFYAKDLGRGRLRNFFYKFSFRLFDSGTAVHLNISELTSIFHFPSYEIFAPKVKFLKLKKSEPPANLPQEGLLLGKNNFRDKETEARIAEDDRRRHFYLVGQTGTGKSVLMKNMILQDIKAGNGVCFIDPHGDSVEEILGQIPKERWDDVIYFNPGDVTRPFGLNMLEYNPEHPEQKTFIVNELLEIFNKLYDMSVAGGPMFEQYFRNAALLVMAHPESGNTMLEISRVLSDTEFRRLKLSKCKNEVVKNFWVSEAEKAGGDAALPNMVPYITSKFDTFLSNEIMRPILCQQKSTISFREAMDGQKIFLINLSKGRLGETNAHLLGMILVGRLFMAAMSRVDTPESERKDFYLYMDEFQNITTKTISAILSEARKYRLSLTIAHQFIGQLEEDIKKAVFGNVGSLASFRVGEEDAEFLEKYFEPVFTREHLINISNYNAYIKLLINGQTSRPFNIETYPPEQSDQSVAEIVKEDSAVKYGHPLSEVEAEISHRYLIS